MLLVLFISSVVSAVTSNAQTAWFIDGYHGGVYGHYLPGYTGFLIERLKGRDHLFADCPFSSSGG